MLGLREEQPDGAEDARRRWHEHVPHAERTGDLDADDGPVATEGAEREVARVAAAVGGDSFDGAGHGGDGDHQHAVGRLEHRQAEAVGDGVAEHVVCGRYVEGDGAAGELARVQVAEHGEGVRQRRLLSSASVTDGAGGCAGAAGADARTAERVDADDGATAGADLRHVDEGQLDRVAAALDEPAREVDAAADLVLGRPHGLAVLEHGGLGGGAAHVEGDDVGAARVPGQLRAGDHAGGRPRFDEVGGPPQCGGGAHGAAGRLHDLQGRRDAALRELAREGAEVGADCGPDVGVDDGGARALVLADLREDVGGAGDVDAVTHDRPHELGDPVLVPGARVGVQQRDRECVDVVAAHRFGGGDHGSLVELAPGLASRACALGHLVAPPSRHERRRLVVLEVVHDGDAEAAHLEHVAEAGRRDQRGTRALPLEHGVRGDRGGMDDPRHLAGRDARLLEQAERALDHTAGVVVRGGEHLAGAHRPVAAEQHDVRERAADVDAEAVPGCALPSM